MLITALRKDCESLFQQGLRLGEQKGKINIAKILLAAGLELSMIAQVTQLPLEEVEQLQHHQTDTNQ